MNQTKTNSTLKFQVIKGNPDQNQGVSEISFNFISNDSYALLKTTQLALTDLNLHFIQNLRQFLLRDSKVISDFETHSAGKFSVFCLFQDCFFKFLAIHHFKSPSPALA